MGNRFNSVSSEYIYIRCCYCSIVESSAISIGAYPRFRESAYIGITMTTQPEKLLSKTKIAIMCHANAVFYSTICMHMQHIFDDSIPTACVLDTTVKYNTKFFMELTSDERVFLMLHETMHIAYLHASRLASRSHKLWNMACDYVINLQLVQAGFPMPKEGLLDRRFAGMSAEEVYEILIQKNQPEDIPWDDLAPTDNTSPETEQQVADIITTAIIQATQQGQANTIPGQMQVFLNKLTNPKMPWKTILSRYMHSLKKNDHTWAKRNRRFPKHYLPTMQSKDLLNIAVGWDMSGSVTDAETSKFASECASILKQLKPEVLTLVQFDTRVFQVNKLKNIQDMLNLKLKGRGGTDLNDLALWTQTNKPNVTLIFTDGHFTFPEEKFYGNIIWLIHNNRNFSCKTGKVIHYEV